jgi:hypothetical protein
VAEGDAVARSGVWVGGTRVADGERRGTAVGVGLLGGRGVGVAVGRGGAAVAVRLCAVAVPAAVPVAIAWAVRMTCASAACGLPSAASAVRPSTTATTTQARTASLAETMEQERRDTKGNVRERGGALRPYRNQRPKPQPIAASRDPLPTLLVKEEGEDERRRTGRTRAASTRGSSFCNFAYLGG